MNYYPRHIGDYLTATAHLSLLEHGVYARLLDVYYTREAPIPDAQAERLVGARTQEERDAVRVVLEEFFELVGGEWRQSRCDEEIAKYHEKSDKAKASAAASVNARQANAQRTLNERSTNVELTNNQEPITNTPSLRSGGARASRLPADWEPNDADWGMACIALHTEGAKRELAKFRDYWAAKAGAGGSKADWGATWRNWVRKAGEYAQSGRTGERLSAVERVKRDGEEWLKRQGGADVLAAYGEPVRSQVDQPIRLVAGRVVDGGADEVGF